MEEGEYSGLWSGVVCWEEGFAETKLSGEESDDDVSLMFPMLDCL